jgi:hypothetical protein
MFVAGGENRRSLAFARDDKKGRAFCGLGLLLVEGFVVGGGIRSSFGPQQNPNHKTPSPFCHPDPDFLLRCAGHGCVCAFL